MALVKRPGQNGRGLRHRWGRSWRIRRCLAQITDLTRGGDDDFKVCLEQFSDDGTFVAACCFEDYQGDAVRLKGFDELFCARGGVGQRDVDEAGTRLGPPPKGYANWTLRLLAQGRQLEIVDAVGYETVRRTLKKTV